MIDVVDVRKSYRSGDRQIDALRGISCRVPRGRFALYGLSPFAQWVRLERFGAVTTRTLTLEPRDGHFTAVAGTSDYAYGQSACKSLAISNPAEAVMNADSHEYFAENNPSLN